MIKIICPQCNKEFFTHPYRLKQSKRVFCSVMCMGDSMKLSAAQKELSHQKRLEYMRNDRRLHPEKGKKYRAANKEHLQELAHKAYLANKEKYIERGKVAYGKRKKRYHSDNGFNLYEVIKVAKYRIAKMKRDKEWKKNQIAKSRAKENEYQAITIENISQKGLPWGEGEKEYLEREYANKTTLEMALDLGRTFKATKAALDRFDIDGSKQRHLNKFFNLPRETILASVKESDPEGTESPKRRL